MHKRATTDITGGREKKGNTGDMLCVREWQTYRWAGARVEIRGTSNVARLRGIPITSIHPVHVGLGDREEKRLRESKVAPQGCPPLLIGLW